METHKNLEYIVGNAQDIPLASSDVDIVLNVESSFHYPDFQKFVSEVYRVLKPGGLFLWTAPLLNTGETPALKKEIFAKAGFVLLKEMDITHNVLNARQIHADQSSSDEFEIYCPEMLRSQNKGGEDIMDVNLWEWAALPRSFMYKSFASGETPYLRYIAQRPKF